MPVKKAEVPLIRWGELEHVAGWQLDVPGLAAVKHPDGHHWLVVHMASGKKLASVPRRKDCQVVALAISDVDWTVEEPETSHLHARLRDVVAALYGAAWRKANK